MAYFPRIIGRHVMQNAIWSSVVARIGHSTFQNVLEP